MPMRVRRPKAIVFDILGTASKSGFLEKILFPFLRVNLDAYVNTHWTRKDFVRLHTKILDQSIEFNKQEPMTPIVLQHDDPQSKASLLNFINFVTENGVNSPAVTQLRFQVWFEGYQQSKLHTPIYSDVPNQVKRWYAEGIKFYVFSNTWAEAQRALLRNTNHGDLTNLISGHYDNDFGSLTDPNSWRRLCAEINVPANEVLFLTKSPLEGHAASEAGLTVVLVLTHRHNVKAVSKEDRQVFPFVRTLNDIVWLEGSMMPAASASGGAPASNVSAPPTALSAAAPASQPLVSSSGQASSGASSQGAMTQMPTTRDKTLSQATHTGNSRSTSANTQGSSHSSHSSHSRKADDTK